MLYLYLPRRPIVCTDALSGSGIEDLKNEAIIRCAKARMTLLSNLWMEIVNNGDVVLLVTRLILLPKED